MATPTNRKQIEEAYKSLLDYLAKDIKYDPVSFSRFFKPQPELPPSKESKVPTEEKLPKQDLLIKLMMMTTSANDGEALIALRKASALMTSAGWDWRKLIEGKITVVADPFASIGTPKTSDAPSREMATPARPTPPPASSRLRRSAPTYQPKPPPPPMPNSPLSGFQAQPKAAQPQRASQQAPKNYSIKPNRYDGYCYCCGTQVEAQKHFIFMPSNYNSQAAPNKWQMICQTCNQGAHVPASPAPRRKPAPAPQPSVSNSALNNL